MKTAKEVQYRIDQSNLVPGQTRRVSGVEVIPGAIAIRKGDGAPWWFVDHIPTGCRIGLPYDRKDAALAAIKAIYPTMPQEWWLEKLTPGRTGNRHAAKIKAFHAKLLDLELFGDGVKITPKVVRQVAREVGLLP